MNTGKKRFDLTRGNAVAGTLEVSKGGREACLWHTILLARSSVLYLLFREADKGVVSTAWTTRLYLPKTAAKNCEDMSRVWLLFS